MRIDMRGTQDFIADVKDIPETETTLRLWTPNICGFGDTFNLVCAGVAAIPRHVTTLSFRGVWFNALSDADFSRLMRAIPPHVVRVDLSGTALSLRYMNSHLSFIALSYLTHVADVDLRQNSFDQSISCMPVILNLLGRKRSIDLRGNDIDGLWGCSLEPYIDALVEISATTNVRLEPGPVSESVASIIKQRALSTWLLGLTRAGASSAFYRAFGPNAAGENQDALAERALLKEIKKMM